MSEGSASKRPSELTSPDTAAKRRHTPYKSPPAPPAPPSPAAAVFRILCPAANSWEVIGKGNAIVRHICDETGARIRVEDPVRGSNDCVIVVSADAQPKQKSDSEEGQASPAQRALVKVFERILIVQEERLGEGEQKELLRGSVSCRLLAQAGQVGCVLGIGGKTVEKIRQDSGAQIRVFSKNEVPACAAAGEDLIYITGSFSAVRKALLLVSSCIQDNMRTELTSFIAAKPFGSTPRGVGPSLMGDTYSQRSYLPTPNALDHYPTSHSRNLGIEATTYGQRKVQEDEVMFKMLCTNDKVGGIIGRAGVIIQALQGETGASIRIYNTISDSDDRIVLISAWEKADSKHSPAQEAVLRVHARLVEVGADKGSAVSARLLVPVQQAGCLWGIGGSIIADMRRATGANIRILPKEQFPNYAQPNDEVVQVTGTFQCVQDALLHITGKIRETIFPLKAHPSTGLTSYPSAAPDITPTLLRPIIEPGPPSRYSVGFSHGLDSSISISAPTDRQAAVPHGVDIVGADHVPFSSSEGPVVHAPFAHASPPRSWPSLVVNSGNPRGIADGGARFDFRSGTGSESQTAGVPNTIITVVVPQHLLMFVYGEGGSNLNEIREISGAKVMVLDPEAGASEGKAVISGSPFQTRTAQSLLHAFIFRGQNPS